MSDTKEDTEWIIPSNSPKGATFKATLIRLLSRGLEAIRYAVPINQQYAYELADAIHNFPAWIDNDDAFIIEDQIFRALALILDKDRQFERHEKFIGREGFARYDQQIELMEFAFAPTGEFLGVSMGEAVYNDQNI